MRAGKLRHRIEIQQKTITQDAYGAPVITWTKFADVWASVEPLNSREFFAAQSVQSEVSGKIILRYLYGITTKMRVVHAGEVYDITGALNDGKSGKEYIVLMVSKGLNNG